MNKPEMFVIEKIEGSEVVLTKKSEIKRIPISKLTMVGGAQVTRQNVPIGAPVKLEYNNSILKSAIIDLNSTMPQSAFKPIVNLPPNPIRNSVDTFEDKRLVQSLIPNFNQLNVGLPPASREISLFKSIKDSLPNSPIQRIFESYREIKTGPNNMPIAAITAILDLSVINSDSKIVEKIYHLINSYKDQVNNSERSLEIIVKAYNIIISNNNISQKLQELEKIYENNSFDLGMLCRDCIKLSTILLYHTEKNEFFRAIKPLDEYIKIADTPQGTFDHPDFKLFFDYFDIHAIVVDSENLQVSSLSSGAVYNMHFLENSKGYHPLYTIQESCLKNESDYVKLKNFLNGIATEDTRSVNCSIISSENNLKSLLATKEEIIKTLISLNSTNFAKNLNELENKLGCSNGFNFSYFSDCECSNCQQICVNAKYVCGHKFCRICITQCNNSDRSYCKICGIGSNRNIFEEFVKQN